MLLGVSKTFNFHEQNCQNRFLGVCFSVMLDAGRAIATASYMYMQARCAHVLRQEMFGQVQNLQGCRVSLEASLVMWSVHNASVDGVLTYCAQCYAQTCCA